MTRSALNILMMVVLFFAVISRAFLTPAQYEVAFCVFLGIYAVGMGTHIYSNRRSIGKQELVLNSIILLAILLMIARQLRLF